MKTPDETKKGLECCRPIWKSDHFKTCDSACPYVNEGHFCRTMLNSDALALIQQLKAQIPRWISIRDALPGLHEKVLFTPMCNEGAIYIGELNAVGEYGAAYFAVRCGKRKTCYSATHWMPLPEPPKEEEK